MMCKSIIFPIILLNLFSSLYGFISTVPSLKCRQSGQMSTNYCILPNKMSYYNTHAIVSNQTRDISNIYTTYDNKNTIIFYKNGSYAEHLNKTLRLKYSTDVLNLHIVSNIYFQNIYKTLKHIL